MDFFTVPTVTLKVLFVFFVLEHRRRQLKEILRASRSRPVGEVIEKINPILRGWVKYFAVGHSSRCFSFIRDWVEKKIRRHLARACQRRGFGWKRWSREWIYGTLGLFSEYRVCPGSASAVAPV
jgi:RNA-directed DNA polymerase